MEEMNIFLFLLSSIYLYLFQTVQVVELCSAWLYCDSQNTSYNNLVLSYSSLLDQENRHMIGRDARYRRHGRGATVSS
jgi:hypothetical protein